MISHKRILKNIARNHKLDPVELLVVLWDFSRTKFDYLKNENSAIKNKDYLIVKRIIDSKLKNIKISRLTEVSTRKPEVVIKDQDFSSVGKVISSINFLTKEEVLKIYEELVLDFSTYDDPIEPSGVKDETLLDSAIFHATTSYENKSKYPTVESSAAALMYALTHNHAFHNGNKRTAMVSMLVFLDRHNICLDCNEDDLFKTSLRLADHKLVEETSLYMDAEIYALAKWIHDNSKVLKKGERSVTLKKLKQILSHFGCELLENGRVQRIIFTRSFLGYTSRRILTSKRVIPDTVSEGQEIEKGLIKSIREDLELNPTKGGIDSDVFYDMTSFTSSDFINKYKVLLRKLSKV